MGGRGGGSPGLFVVWSDFLMKSSTSYQNVQSDNAKMENENKGLRIK